MTTNATSGFISGATPVSLN